jgi:hypothetical protein
MIPERIEPLGDPCGLVDRWLISQDLAQRLIRAASFLPFPVTIISGYRTPAKQLSLAREGRPTAAVDRSTHTSCPATGADIWPGIAVTRVVQATLGEALVRAGLRWGGGSPVDSGGMPSDWNHADLGPRSV